VNSKISRRKLLAAPGAIAIAQTAAPRFEARDGPKICLGFDAAGGAFQAQAASALSDEAGARRIRQLGVDHVISGFGPIPWDETRLKDLIDRLKAQGLTLANVMITGFPNAIYNRPGRDEDIEKVIQSIKTAGKLGLPVV